MGIFLKTHIAHNAVSNSGIAITYIFHVIAPVLLWSCFKSFYDPFGLHTARRACVILLAGVGLVIWADFAAVATAILWYKIGFYRPMRNITADYPVHRMYL